MLVNFVILLSIVLGCCGLIMDVGLFELKRLQLQDAADAAALGAAFALQTSNQPSVWQPAGIADAKLNGFTNGVSNVTVSFASPPTSGDYVGDGYAVQATVTQPASALFFPNSFLLMAQATALVPPIPCVYLLSQYTTGVSLNAINETMTPTCPMYLGRSYYLNGGSSSSGSQFFVQGGSSGSSGSVSPAPVFGSPGIADPLSYVPAPVPASSCTGGVNQNINISSGTTQTASQATYCGNSTVSGTGTLAFNAGIYIFCGSLNINGPNITGSGVQIYMTSCNGYGYGTAMIQNTQMIALSAPTTGTRPGILFFSDRNMPTGQQELTFNYLVGNNCYLDGILYLPGQEIKINDATMQAHNYFGIVADNIVQINNSTFSPSANYTSLSGGNPFHEKAVYKVE